MLSRIFPTHLFRKKRGADRKPRNPKGRARPQLESLESRTVLYATTGNLWPNPGLITISFMPDGTNLGGPVSNLNAAFNSKPALNQAGNTWQTIIERAAQTWAAATNINFAVVPDDGAPSGSAGNEQGDPGYGDIRIGGYNFGTSTLARTFQPPQANNYSIAGDIAFNTGQSFNVNTTYDLYTVAVHEIGHALGLDHSSASAQTEMYPTYNGVKQSLSADDTAGIRNIYSGNAARDMDRFARAGVSNHTFATASPLATFVSAYTQTAAVTGLDLYAASDVEYLTATVPTGTTGTMSVNVQSSGISLLSPKVTVYAADMKTILGTATGLGKYGTSVTLSVPKLIAGQHVYLVVQGADSSVFATGSYDLGLSFNANAAPTFATTARPIAAGLVLTSGGGIADVSNTEEDHYTGQAPTVLGVVDDTGASSNDGVTDDSKVVPRGTAAAGDTVSVYRNGVIIGTTVADQNNNWSLSNTTQLADGFYAFTATSTDPSGNVSLMSDPFYARVNTVAPNTPTINAISPDNGFSATDALTNVQNPTFSGTAEPGSKVTLINASNNGSNLYNVPVGTTIADSQGNWKYTIPGGGLSGGTYLYTATATDVAGNVCTRTTTFTVVIDRTAPVQPVVTSISPDTGLVTTDHATDRPRLVFNGTAEAGDWVYISLDGQPLGMTASNTSTGAWSYDNTANVIADGTHSVTVTTMDRAGNFSNASQAFALTVDTIATAAPVITTLSPDTGRSATDWVTSNKQNAILSGTTIGNGIVQVFRGGALLGQTTAAGNGQWSFTDQSNFTDGSYVYTAKVTDYVGNVSAASAPQTMVVDTAAPVAPVIAGFGPDSGVVGDSITNVKTPTLFGTAEPNSTVTLYLSGQSQSAGWVLADASGNWKFTIPGPGLNDGSYKFTATATDAAGNVSQSSSPPLYLAIDTTAPSAPVVTGISPDTGLVATDGATNQPRLVFKGTAEAGSTVGVYLITGSGPQATTQFLGTTKAVSNGAWSYDNTANVLPDGVYSVSAAATDAAGNTGQLAKGYAVTVATAAPTPPSVSTIGTFWGTAGSGGLTNASKPTFSGTTIPGGIVNLYLGTTLIGTATASTDHGAWSVTSSQTLADGSYSVTATTTDYVGNVSGQSSSFAFTLDDNAPNKPAVLAISPDTGVSNTDGITSINTPTFSGTAEPGSTVNVSAAAGTSTTLLGTAVANANGNWALAVTRSLNDGSYNVTATATDVPGNTSSISTPFKLTIITKIGDPKATGISPDTGAKSNDGVTNARNIILSGTSDPNDTITVSQNGAAIGTAVAGGSGAWSYDNRAVSLADGTYAFTFAASDAAGNVSVHPATQNVTIETVAYAPVIAGVVKSVNGLGTPILVISGTAEVQGQVNVLVNGLSIGTTNADGQGNWQLQYVYSNSATSFSFTGITTDLAGNVSPASSAFSLLLKNAASASGLNLAAASILSVDSSGTPQTTNNTPTITGHATAGSLVRIVDGNTILGTVVADSKGNWVFVSLPLAKGKHSLFAEASDAYGNYGLLSNPLTFNV